jgi:hypothetical protein
MTKAQDDLKRLVESDLYQSFVLEATTEQAEQLRENVLTAYPGLREATEEMAREGTERLLQAVQEHRPSFCERLSNWLNSKSTEVPSRGFHL